MTFGADTTTDEVIAVTLVEHPRVAASLAAANVAAWDVVDPILLELCRLRLAQLFGDTGELALRTPAALVAGLDESMVRELRAWPQSPHFGPRERACLAFCEQFFLDVANVTANETEAISAEIGAQGLVDFVSALLVIEQRQRLRLAWGKLFGEEHTS
jgi:alkylhydroperoxidase family enzyme